ncbi:hypothetical protein O6H91_13G040600 [Diphasiastrum complanatum]|uniref:Uncharacterized protein n=1 Tax=Diphasiastrum complanatum TaxID=34168 RepID=A0ACC2BU15_DIPCM|nr:hypothetical protein O6H91_13G040600 [Diphasiastrum complanatum]
MLKASLSSSSSVAVAAEASRSKALLLTNLALNIIRGGSETARNWPSKNSTAALCEIRERAKKADFILEVRDARIPVSSTNEVLRELGTSTNHFIVLNKMDLANPSMTWKAYYQLHEQWHVFVNTHNKDSVKDMLKEMKVPLDEMLKQEKPLLGLVVGVPNIGKSALINSLQLTVGNSQPAKERAKKAEVGPLPGITKKISSYQEYCLQKFVTLRGL